MYNAIYNCEAGSPEELVVPHAAHMFGTTRVVGFLGKAQLQRTTGLLMMDTVLPFCATSCQVMLCTASSARNERIGRDIWCIHIHRSHSIAFKTCLLAGLLPKSHRDAFTALASDAGRPLRVVWGTADPLAVLHLGGWHMGGKCAQNLAK
jgi:hypothetical protein